MSDELTQLRTENWDLRQKLDRQIAAWNGGTDALTAHAARQAQRIAELEATVHAKIRDADVVANALDDVIDRQTARIAELEAEVTGVRLSAAVMKGAYIEASDKATELEAQVQRLEAEKRRLIAQIPYEDLRYIINSHPNLRVDMRIEAKRWLDTVEVPHD